MSTPTTHAQLPTSKPTPRSAGAGLTPSASSPTRSVPSPAYLAASSTSHQKTNKSPYKNSQASTQTSLAGNYTNSHTPTPQGLNAGSSPAGAFNDILGRGRSGTVSAKSAVGSEANTPGLSAIGLGLGLTVGGQMNENSILNGIDVGGLATVRDAEAWNAQRTREIVELLSTRWGKVSRESVERCAKRVGGLECLWEDGSGTMTSTGEKQRTLSVASNEMLIDVEWLGERAQKVVLTFQRVSGVTINDELGAEILRRNLTGEDDGGTDGGYVELDQFIGNLQRLARNDQLGRAGVSCFEALDGLHTSLKRLWDWETEKLGQEKSMASSEHAVQLEVLSQGSGRPALHSRTKIGLKLDYWIDRMGVAPLNAAGNIEDDRLWTMLVECEACDATQFPPIRVSDNWLAENIDGMALTDEPGMAEGSRFINWLEPEPTTIPITKGDPMDLDSSAGTQPNVRFVAKLVPPVILPLKIACDIFDHVGQPIPQVSIQSTTFASLLFPHLDNTQTNVPVSELSKEHVLRFRRTVHSFDSGTAVPHQHHYNFFTAPDAWARTIYEIPFSHPRQLVEILPYLRQWALFERLVRRSLGLGSQPLHVGVTQVAQPSTASKAAETTVTNLNGALPRTKATKPTSRYRRLVTPPSDTDSDGEEDERQSLPQPQLRMVDKPLTPAPEPTIDTVMDITFDYSPLAQRIDLDCTIPGSWPSDGEESKVGVDTMQLRVHIFANGRIELEEEGNREEDTTGQPNAAPKDEEQARLLRVFKTCQDIGVFAAWFQMDTRSKAAPTKTEIGGGGVKDDAAMDES